MYLGFDGTQLNVLIVRQKESGNDDNSTNNYKLPGSLIYMDENLDEAAKRVLKQLTGLVQIRMVQFRAFGDARRLANPNDKVWLERFHHLEHHLERIVTIAYLSLCVSIGSVRTCRRTMMHNGLPSVKFLSWLSTTTKL